MLGLYLNLYKQYNQLTVLRNHLKLTRQVLERMHARREQGTALKNDITRYELQQKQLQLQLTQTQNACRIMNHQLSTTLHLPEGTEILPDTLLLDRQIDSLHEKTGKTPPQSIISACNRLPQASKSANSNCVWSVPHEGRR